MKIYLFRHGQTLSNEQHRYLGNREEPLSENGRTALQKMAASLNMMPSVVYTSSLSRTKESAAILFPEARIVPVQELNEMDFGDFEGKDYRELSDDPHYQEWVDSGCTLSCPNGERKDLFQKRILNGFDRLPKDEGDLVLVVHGGTIMSILDAYEESKTGYFQYALKNGEWYEAEVLQKAGSMILAHLKKH